MRYLKMENASLEVDIDFIENLINFINCNIQSIIDLNFQRIIFNIPQDIIEEAINYLDKIIEEQIGEKEILFMIRSELDKNFNVDSENVLIINLSDSMLDNELVYNEIDLTEDNLRKINELLNKNINIIVNPIIDCDNIKQFNDNLIKMYENNEDKEISLGGYLIPAALMKEHPCNANLCDGWKCGKKISQLPKVITIKFDGSIYPHNINKKDLLIGNIIEDNLMNILENYFMSQEYKNFKKLVENNFIKYVPNYPYQLFPLDCYLKWEAEKND